MCNIGVPPGPGLGTTILVCMYICIGAFTQCHNNRNYEIQTCISAHVIVELVVTSCKLGDYDEFYHHN